MAENWISFCVLPAAAGFLLDLLLGDPAKIPHPVMYIGRLISLFEKRLLITDSEKKGRNRKNFANGCVSSVVVVVFSVSFAAAVVFAFSRINEYAAMAAATLLCWQMYAAKGLKRESMKVFRAQAAGDTESARGFVSMIVGRDTENLDSDDITRAAVETVAENTSDAVIAPMFYMTLFGAAGAYLYKSVNTLDSMIGYKNDKYEYYGKFAARFDDALNFIPARISALLMIVAAVVMPPEKKTGFRVNAKNAVKIFKRDRLKHASPNSAHTESVCAGALGVRLAGSAYYFGKRVEKPYIGDDTREIEPADILRANRLMYGASFAGVSVVIIAGVAVKILLLS